MPMIIASLLGGLLSIASSMLGRFLIALGVGVVSYIGVDVTMGWLHSSVMASLSGVGGQIAGVIGLLKIDSAINVIFSAYTARMTLRGIAGGAIKSMVLK